MSGLGASPGTAPAESVGRHQMNQKTAYGHSRFGFPWQELLSVGDDGLDCNGKSYHWSDIKKVKRYDSLFWAFLLGQAGAPMTYIFLNDGTRIRIRGRFLQREGEGQKSKVDFLRGSTITYDVLMDFIQERVPPEALRLSRGGLHRLFYGVFFLFFACLVGGLWAILYRSQPDHTFRFIMRFVALDLLFLLVFVLLLALVWCLFAPRWVERILEMRARKLLLAAIVLVVGLVVLMALPGIMTS